MEYKPILTLIVGASGSGKTSLGQQLKEMGINELISHTTREIRQGEIDGQTYYYITKEEFDKLDKLEQTCYSGNYYCLSRDEVERHTEKVVYAIVDAKGVKQIQEKYGKSNTIVIYIKVTYLRMILRMLKRGDKITKIIQRIKNCIITREMKNHKLADIVIENKDLQQAKFDLMVELDSKLREKTKERKKICTKKYYTSILMKQ